MEYLTAEECKNAVTVYLESKVTPEIDSVYADIYEEISFGNLHMFRSGELQYETVRFLEAKGFTYAKFINKGKTYYEVKWG